MLVAIVGCGRSAAPVEVEFEALGDGIGFAQPRITLGQDGEPAELAVLRFDPHRWSLGVVHRPELADAAMFRADADAVAAINGIYFDPQYKPLGLLVSEGRQLSRLRRVDHGVFTIAAGVPGLQHARSFVAPPQLEFAAECGPRLVVDGEPLALKPGLARRSAIAFDAAGRVMLVATAAVVSLRDLATLLARPTAEGGFGARGALNLDGGSSTMFDLAIGKRRAQVRSAVRVPVGIVVRPRTAVPRVAADAGS